MAVDPHRSLLVAVGISAAVMGGKWWHRVGPHVEAALATVKGWATSLLVHDLPWAVSS